MLSPLRCQKADDNTELMFPLGPGADGLVLALLRQVAIGDLSEANTWLACTLLHTLRNAYQQWLCKAPSLLMQAVLYKYLRVLPDAARGTKHVEQVGRGLVRPVILVLI